MNLVSFVLHHGPINHLHALLEVLLRHLKILSGTLWAAAIPARMVPADLDSGKTLPLLERPTQSSNQYSAISFLMFILPHTRGLGQSSPATLFSCNYIIRQPISGRTSGSSSLAIGIAQVYYNTQTLESLMPRFRIRSTIMKEG